MAATLSVADDPSSGMFPNGYCLFEFNIQTYTLEPVPGGGFCGSGFCCPDPSVFPFDELLKQHGFFDGQIIALSCVPCTSSVS